MIKQKLQLSGVTNLYFQSVCVKFFVVPESSAEVKCWEICLPELPKILPILKSAKNVCLKNPGYAANSTTFLLEVTSIWYI